MTTTTTYTELIDAVIDTVRARGDITMGGIRRVAASRGMTVAGDLDMWIVPNVFIAFEVSREFIEFFDALRTSGRLDPWPADVMVLMYEGDEICDLPIPKHLPPAGYKKPHWLPMLFTAAKVSV